MAILVDPLHEWPSGQWAHMMSDIQGQAGLDELHAIAARLGLRRAWFQDKPRYPHYDLRPSKRKLAIKYGALAVDAIELVRRCRWAPTNTDDVPGIIPAEPPMLLPAKVMADLSAAPQPPSLFTEAELSAITPAGPVLARGIRDMHRVHGSGPDGATCGTCISLERYRQSSSWMKCGKSFKTASAATDWRAGWRACGLYVAVVKESTDAR